MAASDCYTITIMGEDRLGVMADISGAVGKLGGNIESLSHGNPEGYYVITLVTTFAQPVEEADVRAAVEGAGGQDEFIVSLLAHHNDVAVPLAAEGERYILSVRGADTPGLINKTARYLSDHHVNFENFSAEAIEKQFTLVARLTVPNAADLKDIRAGLSELLAAQGATVALMHENIFYATNRVEMSEKETA